MEETDLTRQDGEPTPRADVQFVKVSIRTPLGFRFDAESRTSPHSAGDRAVALMLLILAGTVFSGTLAGLVLLVGGPGWTAPAVGAAGVLLTAIAGRRALAPEPTREPAQEPVRPEPFPSRPVGTDPVCTAPAGTNPALEKPVEQREGPSMPLPRTDLPEDRRNRRTRWSSP